jgi:hypothetical protein
MEATNDLPKTAVSIEQVSRLIEARAVYAVFDSVGVPRVPAKMQALASGRALSLFLGTPFESYTAVAPYLASLDPELLDWTRRELWQGPWGILVFSRAPLDELFQHFRRFLTVHMPNGQSAFFRFQDPRILPTFLQSAESRDLGFWNGIAGYGWGEGESVAMVKCPEGAVRNPSSPQHREPSLSPELMRSFGKTQLQNFIDRCIKYFEIAGTALPPDRDAFFQSILRYAGSVEIKLEIDLLRFMQLVLGWKGMQGIPVIREILTYPGVSGTDKVDLLCEMAAFSTLGPLRVPGAGLNPDANAKAGKRFLEDHLNERQFLQAHPEGALTMSQADARWRKEWVKLYTEEVAKQAQVTRVQAGSSSI